MKKTNLLFKNLFLVILIIGCSLTVGCSNDTENKIVKEGYIIGYDACSGTTNNGTSYEAGGYYFVSTDLKDTLLTYNFPSGIYNFPVQQQNFSTPAWFPDTYRNSFKVQITYTESTKTQTVYSACPSIILIQNVRASQVIIKSVKKEE